MSTTEAPPAPAHLFIMGMPVFYQPEVGRPITSGTIVELRQDASREECTYTVAPDDGGEHAVITESQILTRRSTPAEIEAAAKTKVEIAPLPVRVSWHENNSYRLNMDLDLADFMDYIRDQGQSPLDRDFDETVFDDLIQAAGAGGLDDQALLLGFRERITEVLSDERRRALATMLQAYYVERAWPDSSWVKHVNGDNDIDEVDLPQGAVVVVDRTATPGMVHLRGAAFGGYVGSATDLLEQSLPEDPAFSTQFIDGRYSATTTHLLPGYLRDAVEDLLGRVAAAVKDQPHRFDR